MPKHSPKRLLRQFFRKCAWHPALLPVARDLIRPVPCFSVCLCCCSGWFDSQKEVTCDSQRAQVSRARRFPQAHLLTVRGQVPQAGYSPSPHPCLFGCQVRQLASQEALAGAREHGSLGRHNVDMATSPGNQQRPDKRMMVFLHFSLGTGCHQNAAILVICPLWIHTKFSSSYWLLWKRLRFKGKQFGGHAKYLTLFSCAFIETRRNSQRHGSLKYPSCHRKNKK